jgi:hypothetical protein
MISPKLKLLLDEYGQACLDAPGPGRPFSRSAQDKIDQAREKLEVTMLSEKKYSEIRIKTAFFEYYKAPKEDGEYGLRVQNAQWEMFKDYLTLEGKTETTGAALLETINPPVFVFGSNEAGVHGSGAALFARKERGAVYGVGFGHTGNSFAVPTKDFKIKTLPLVNIKNYVGMFLEYARMNPDIKFEVTRIGCGLAGYTDSDIAPMFKNAPPNCILPEGWKDYGTDKSS